VSPSSLIPSPASLAAKPRLKLPAYGKQLLNARRLGQHPLVVHVIYGEEWRPGERCGAECEGAEHPRLAVRPSEFQPWTIDWHVVTGCKVVVFESMFDRRRNFYDLLGELGRFAGPVHVMSPDDEQVTAADALALRVKKMFGDWPRWWPIETERLNGERRERWFRLTAARPEPVSAAA
jgi:hypothetical protein